MLGEDSARAGPGGPEAGGVGGASLPVGPLSLPSCPPAPHLGGAVDPPWVSTGRGDGEDSWVDGQAAHREPGAW